MAYTAHKNGKKRCPRGHRFKGDNVAYKPNGSQYCVQCNRERAVEAADRQRALTPDLISCLECGKRLKQLGQHLWWRHDMDVAAYREKHPGAPTVCPSTSKLHAGHSFELARDRFGRQTNDGLGYVWPDEEILE